MEPSSPGPIGKLPNGPESSAMDTPVIALSVELERPPSPRAQTSYIDQLPFDVVEILCRTVHKVAGCDTLLKVALASSALFAPAVSMVVQEGSHHDWRVAPYSSTLSKERYLSTRTLAVGSFITFVAEQDWPTILRRPTCTVVAWHLALPLRSATRELVPHMNLTNGTRQVAGVVSAKWSLVPIPNNQLRTYTIRDTDVARLALPSYLHSLSFFSDRAIPDARCRELPHTLQSLTIITFGRSPVDLTLVASHMPSLLRSLALCVQEEVTDGVLANIMARLPGTLEALYVDVNADEAIGEEYGRALIERIPHLPRLKFLYIVWPVILWPDLHAALVKNKTSRFALPVDYLHLTMVHPLTPTFTPIPSSLCVSERLEIKDVDLDLHDTQIYDLEGDDDKLANVVDFILRNFPVATQTLHVNFLTWKPEWLSLLLTLAPLTLHTLGLGSEVPLHPRTFADIGFPSTIRNLRLHKCLNPQHIQPLGVDHVAWSAMWNSLVSLVLTECNLTSSDLEKWLPLSAWPLRLRQLVLSRNWLESLPQRPPLPSSLVRLNLSENKLEALPRPLPPKLVQLSLSDNPNMVAKDPDPYEWAVNLPLSLRVLEIKNSRVDDRIGDGLLHWVGRLAEQQARRVQLRFGRNKFSAHVLDELRRRVGEVGT